MGFSFKDFFNDIISLNNPADALYQTLGIFLTNYINMKNAKPIKKGLIWNFDKKQCKIK